MPIWSRYYDKCTNCGLNDTKHTSRGLCKRCYDAIYRKEHREQKKSHNLAYKRERDFGKGNWELVLARSNGKCVKCGEPATLVHHLDNNGRRSLSWLDQWIGDEGGHDPNRMEALCRACHAKEHEPFGR